MRILVVDENKSVLSALRILLNTCFEDVILLPSPDQLLTVIKEKNPDVALLCMNLSVDSEEFFWLSEIKKLDAELPVVLFTACADIDLAVRALKEGAFDFVVKPCDNAKLLATLQSAWSLRQSRKEVKKLTEKQQVLNRELSRECAACWGQSEVMQELMIMVRKVAVTDANVLITGETGTGKEVIAKEIHKCSLRANETLVTADLGTITETLVESELFGHVKGAFIDAKSDCAGNLEAADNGTLFLDEITNLSYPLQAKLLTVLQSRKVTRIGSNKPISVNIRLISATNREIFKAAHDGLFRKDLLYRINTIHLEIPPLRERREDIVPLADFFLKRFAEKYLKGMVTLSKETAHKLEKYNWPGNIRELKHAVEKAVILCDSHELQPSDFYIRSLEDRTSLLGAI
ncbi:MAG: sigma-54 dependent transcriptional regulator, partial [Bacteroidales bacterium]|nr:sigma-54 dependent transcriptional regulator [Bacteroidales bacterium]